MVVGDYDILVWLFEYKRDEDCCCDEVFFWGCSDIIMI